MAKLCATQAVMVVGYRRRAWQDQHGCHAVPWTDGTAGQQAHHGSLLIIVQISFVRSVISSAQVAPLVTLLLTHACPGEAGHPPFRTTGSHLPAM